MGGELIIPRLSWKSTGWPSIKSKVIVVGLVRDCFDISAVLLWLFFYFVSSHIGNAR